MFAFGRRERFVLLIGEHGAILSLFVGKKLEKRLFSPGTSVGDRREFNALLQKYTQVPIVILLDIMDQTYTQQTLPAVSMFSVEKLVKKRLQRDLDQNDINGALSLGREKGGRKDWKYLFVSVTQTETLREWIEYVVSLPNPFQGIFLLPIESASVAVKLPLVDKESKAEDSDWKLLVSHHKVSGIRQTVVHKGKTIFSRLIMPGKENMPELLAGYIEQETLNTVEYLSRLSFAEESKLNITLIVSKEIKEHLQKNRIQDHYVEVLTPHETAQAFGLNEISEENDKFADIFFAASFLDSKPQLRLYTPETKQLVMMTSLAQYSTLAVVMISPILVGLSLYTGYGIFSIKQSIKTLENEKADIEAKWKVVQESGGYDIDEATRITNIVQLHTKLTNASESPLPFFEKTKVAIQTEALVKSIQWSYNQSFDPEKKTERMSVKFDMEFLNRGTNIDTLFSNFEAFSRRLKREFKDYELSHTKLPDKITLGQETGIINLQVTITDKLNGREE